MKFKLLILFLSSLFIFSFNNTTLANSNKKLTPKISSVTNFEKFQLSDDVLNEKALNGDLVNNQHTTVTVTEVPEENTKTVEIEKVLSEEILASGEVFTENSKTATTFVLTPLPDTDMSAMAPGNRTGNFRPASLAVNVKVTIYYNTMSKNGATLYKLSSFLITPKTTDSTFLLTKLTYEARSVGSGYLANGKAYTKTESSGLTTTTNVVNNGTYSRSLSFIKYVDTVTAGSTGVTGTLSYKRNNSATIYNLQFSLGA